MTLGEPSWVARTAGWSFLTPPHPRPSECLQEHLLSVFPQLRPCCFVQFDFLLVGVGMAFTALTGLDIHRHGERMDAALDQRTRVRGSRPSGRALPAWISRARGPLLPELLSSVHVPFTELQTLPFINRSRGAIPNGEATCPVPWWSATMRYIRILTLFSHFFLSVTSAFCFLSFRMFPNTSCLVRCLRQTERCRWRQCFIAQFVH